MRFNKRIIPSIRLTVALAGFAGLETLYAQTAAATPSPNQGKPEAVSSSPGRVMTLHVGTHLVVLDVSVFDWKGSLLLA